MIFHAIIFLRSTSPWICLVWDTHTRKMLVEPLTCRMDESLYCAMGAPGICNLTFQPILKRKTSIERDRDSLERVTMSSSTTADRTRTLIGAAMALLLVIVGWAFVPTKATADVNPNLIIVDQWMKNTLDHGGVCLLPNVAEVVIWGEGAQPGEQLTAEVTPYQGTAVQGTGTAASDGTFTLSVYDVEGPIWGQALTENPPSESVPYGRSYRTVVYDSSGNQSEVLLSSASACTPQPDPLVETVLQSSTVDCAAGTVTENYLVTTTPYVLRGTTTDWDLDPSQATTSTTTSTRPATTTECPVTPTVPGPSKGDGKGVVKAPGQNKGAPPHGKGPNKP